MKGKITGYILFCNENRAESKESNPGVDNKEIMKILASKWKEAEETVKADYKDRAMVLSPPPPPAAESGADSGKKAKKASAKAKKVKGEKADKADKPKKASSPYIFFNRAMFAAVKAELPKDTPLPDIAREMGKRWKELDAEAKKTYVDLAAEDKKRIDDIAEAKGKADIGDAVDAAYAAAIPIPDHEGESKAKGDGESKPEAKPESESEDQKVASLEDDEDDMSIATVVTPQAKGKKSVKESS